jgi:hypothetical protein
MVSGRHSDLVTTLPPAVMRQQNWLVPSGTGTSAPIMLTSNDVTNGSLHVFGCGIYGPELDGTASAAQYLEHSCKGSATRTATRATAFRTLNGRPSSARSWPFRASRASAPFYAGFPMFTKLLPMAYARQERETFVLSISSSGRQLLTPVPKITNVIPGTGGHFRWARRDYHSKRIRLHSPKAAVCFVHANPAGYSERVN